ncbi:MAG: flagellar hook-basal body complex protein [Alphaproteobacteria bacterium]|nr:flagellar hook-basal body complex protein [Alphaproteobacteria bacterium]
MSLYGALFAGVGGLKAQGTKIGIISDNIANVNTTGYKATKAAFETLVVNSTSNVSYAPGGVVANSVQLVDKQGILTATDAPTDIAMSGNGFFAVNAQPDGSGQPLYTRAGAFRQDELGNFRNSSGFFLQGWPLDREGRLPGAPGNLNTTSSANLDSLETVNIETQSGVASGTTQIEIGANLDAGEGIYPGSGVDIAMDINNPVNYGISASSVIVPDTAATGNGIVSGDAITVQTGGGLTYTYEYGGFDEGNDIAAGIVNATTATQSFLSSAGGFSAAELSFNIDSGGQLYTFTYVASSPNAEELEFNNLTNLAAAINETGALSARVENGRLYIAPIDANDAMTFTNTAAAPYGALAGGPYAPGATPPDWVNEIGLTDTLVSATPRFASLQGLADLVNDSTGISAVVSNPLSDANIQIYVDDPLDEIGYYDGTDADATTVENTGSLILEFGLATNANFNGNNTATPTALSANSNFVSPLAAAYNAAADGTGTNGENMASGDIVADFSRNVRVYDALGAGHDLRVSFLKIGENNWALEVHSLPASEVNTNLVNGQVSTGVITFNGDGSLRSLSTGLTEPIDITWNNGAQASNITFDWGSAGLPFGTLNAAAIGQTDGLSQFDSAYNVAFVNQNGAPVGELIGVVINDEGFVIASYSNGETQSLYKLPVADFTNPNGLAGVSGNVYAQTQESGEVNLREAGSNGTGTIVSASLESSNVELADELTDMIVAQRAYQASAKVISTSDELLEELNRL